jgi:purine-binding chemotaxis protein CheW
MDAMALSDVQFDGAIEAPPARVPNQFVTFHSGDRSFGIDVMAVREIRSWSPTTALPGQPAGATGVLDIRGSVVQVYDLRALIGGKESDVAHSGQVVLVVALREQEVGILVDAVSDIIFASPEDMRAAPVTGQVLGAAAVVSSLIKTEDRLIAILDLEALFPDVGTHSAAFV